MKGVAVYTGRFHLESKSLNTDLHECIETRIKGRNVKVVPTLEWEKIS